MTTYLVESCPLVSPFYLSYYLYPFYFHLSPFLSLVSGQTCLILCSKSIPWIKLTPKYFPKCRLPAALLWVLLQSTLEWFVCKKVYIYILVTWMGGAYTAYTLSNALWFTMREYNIISGRNSSIFHSYNWLHSLKYTCHVPDVMHNLSCCFLFKRLLCK